MIEVVIFILVTVSIALEPGPNFIKLAYVTGARGTMAGIRTALGIALGAAAPIALVSAGLSWLISTAPELLTWLRYAGGAYLLWQAFSMWRASGEMRVSDNTELPSVTRSLAEIAAGFWLVALNPRTITFYAAFLPLFTNASAETPVANQMLLLGLAVATIFLVVDLTFVAAIDRFGDRIGKIPAIRRFFRYAGATALGLFGLKLMTETR
ncbi:LysE family translocator [Hoeflea sp. WL0058]|uniref:LysE family translocator n=1 Tax=Flavimaribacter sediminis TaxID=2865987 RepID=A0AAE3CZX9_9HYPH|nr:LysE family translocator [Flavimaribacter sediminis]MBW8637119.1 LysE family translocator [Flavimaribacter sediminis]